MQGLLEQAVLEVAVLVEKQPLEPLVQPLQAAVVEVGEERLEFKTLTAAQAAQVS
jgi:hypothetical protein